MALNETVRSTSTTFGSSATQRLKSGFGPSAETCASAFPPSGELSSSAIFQTLPSPLPVFAALQPLGSSPTLASLKLSVVGSANLAERSSRHATHTDNRCRLHMVMFLGWVARSMELAECLDR